MAVVPVGEAGPWARARSGVLVVVPHPGGDLNREIVKYFHANKPAGRAKMKAECQL